MNHTNTLRSFCSQRIAPVAAALTLALTGGSAFASPAGQAAINAKLTPALIPALKLGTSVSKAKPADILLALAFALQDPLNAALTADEIAAGALEADQMNAGKSRADKHTIAGQIIATAAASRTLSPAQLAEVLKKVYTVPSILKPTGKALAVAAALKAAGTAVDGNTLGLILAPVAGTDAEISLLLQNTSKALGKSTNAASGQLKNFVDGLFDGNIVMAANRLALVQGAADKIAAANPVAAGALFGGLVLNNPSGNYTGNANLETFANSILADPKLSKAIGEILGSTLGAHTDKAALDNALNAATAALPIKALIFQGILRAGATADVPLVLDAGVLSGVADRSAFAGVVAVGNGTDTLKLGAIVTSIANGQDLATKTKIGISIISAVAINTPAAAGAATAALFDSVGGNFATDADRLAFGVAAAPKIKGFAGVGSMAATIADRNTLTLLPALASVATSIMAKSPKAATDIAQQISALSAAKITSYVGFADAIADSNKKFVLNAAVGVSITSPADAGKITAKVVTHDTVLDKAALGKAAKIASAVALAVDEERAADIAIELGVLMSDPKALDATKPIKLSSAAAVASALAKAIQAKPLVSTANRMDEIGEAAANMINAILGKSQGATPALKLKAETKLITAVGGMFLKALSKKPTLNGEYGTDATLRLFTAKAILKADQTEAQDIAGSIAQTIYSFYTAAANTATRDALIAPGGALEKAFAKLSGKALSPNNAATLTAFALVRGGTAGTRFEDGTQPAVTGSINDKETDSRNL